jgi:hypothetical protein
MGPTWINVDFDQVTKALMKLAMMADDDGVLPTAAEMKLTHGTSAGPAAGMRLELSRTSLYLAALIEKLKGDLAETSDQVKATVAQLAASDASLADEAAALVGFLDSITPVQNPTTSISSSATHINRGLVG